MNKMTREQKIYFELRFINKITNWKNIASYENMEESVIRTKFKGRKIADYILEKINSTLDMELTSLDNIITYFEEYKKWYTLYHNDERDIFFSTPVELVQWFEGQKNKCGYCGITQSTLHNIVKIRGDSLTLNNKTKRSKGTLEIERKTPADNEDKDKGYRYNNCILACPLCNNAKSNLIDENCWRKLFVKPIQEYYKKLLSSEECKNKT